MDQRRRSGLPTLSAVKVLQARLGLRADLERIALASHVAELGAAAAPEGDACEGLYRLVEAALDRTLDVAPAPSLRRGFEVRLLDVLGFRPVLDRCVACGCGLDVNAYLDLHRGGLLCEAHAERAAVVGPRTVEWMRRVLGAPELDELAGVDLAWADTAARKLRTPFTEFFTVLIGRPLKSAQMLADLGL